jgi:hypothetical protein
MLWTGNIAVVSSELGEYTGLGTTVSCIGRIIGPLISAPLFAWSLTNGSTSPPLNHCLVFFIVAIIQCAMASVAFAMPISIAKPAVDPGDGDEFAPTHRDGESESDEEKASLLYSNADGNDD